MGGQSSQNVRYQMSLSSGSRERRVTEETVRVYLHAHGYVCKRPTWTLRRKAETQAITWETREVRVLLAGATAPEPLPVHDLVEADMPHLTSQPDRGYYIYHGYIHIRYIEQIPSCNHVDLMTLKGMQV